MRGSDEGGVVDTLARDVIEILTLRQQQTLILVTVRISSLALGEQLATRRGRDCILLHLLTLFHVSLVDLEHALQVRIALQLVESSKSLDLAVFDDYDSVGQVQEVDSVCD